MKRLLFVCTGNTCRSPLAEGMFRKMAKDERLDIQAASAGVFAAEGAPISPFSSSILKEKGVDGSLTSNSLKANWVDWADLILTMTMSHKRVVIEKFPRAVDKVFTLKEFVQDGAETLNIIAEREKLYAELQLKEALSQPITEEDRMRITELDLNAPGYDIADPFGGVFDEYKECAEEIEHYLKKLVNKLKSN